MSNVQGTGIGQTLGAMNGTAIALAYTLVNSCLALLLAYGVTFTQQESAAILAFVNNALVLVTYLAHNAAKHTKTVIPAPPIDESHLNEEGTT